MEFGTGPKYPTRTNHLGWVRDQSWTHLSHLACQISKLITLRVLVLNITAVCACVLSVETASVRVSPSLTCIQSPHTLAPDHKHQTSHIQNAIPLEVLEKFAGAFPFELFSHLTLFLGPLTLYHGGGKTAQSSKAKTPTELHQLAFRLAHTSIHQYQAGQLNTQLVTSVRFVIPSQLSQVETCPLLLRAFFLIQYDISIS